MHFCHEPLAREIWQPSLCLRLKIRLLICYLAVFLYLSDPFRRDLNRGQAVHVVCLLLYKYDTPIRSQAIIIILTINSVIRGEIYRLMVNEKAADKMIFEMLAIIALSQIPSKGSKRPWSTGNFT